MAALVIRCAGGCCEVAAIAAAVHVAAVEIFLFRHGAKAADDADVDAIGSGLLLHHVIGVRGGMLEDALEIHGGISHERIERLEGKMLFVGGEEFS